MLVSVLVSGEGADAKAVLCDLRSALHAVIDRCFRGRGSACARVCVWEGGGGDIGEEIIV